MVGLAQRANAGNPGRIPVLRYYYTDGLNAGVLVRRVRTVVAHRRAPLRFFDVAGTPLPLLPLSLP